MSCGHPTPEAFSLCPHLLADPDLDHVARFTGQGTECLYLCDACAAAPGELVAACRACRDRLGESTSHDGAPGIVEEASAIVAVHRPCGFPWPAFVDLQPVLGSDRARFIGVTADATLHEVDLDAGTSRVLLASGLEIARPMLRVSQDGALAAVVDEKGVNGAILDLVQRRVAMPLVRENYHAEHVTFPVAFVERGRTLVVWSPEWNRLDIVDPRTGENLTARPQIQHEAEHYLDYFHSRIEISPGGTWIVDNGWIWHPYGSVVAWNIDAWLANPYESESGPSRRSVAGAAYLWDRPVCWLDGRTLAVWGIGEDDAHMVSALRIVDVATGGERPWFAGPSGDLVFDRELYSIDTDGLAVWNVERGTRLFADARMPGVRYHGSAKVFVSIADGTISVVRGADARWNRGRIGELAARIARERAFEDLPVLGDALEAEGCTDERLLAHCHARGEHADRCWVLDRILAP